MSDLWSEVRSDVMRRLEEHAPTVPFEDRVRIAEDVAREVMLDAELFAVPNRTICTCVDHLPPDGMPMPECPRHNPTDRTNGASDE